MTGTIGFVEDSQIGQKVRRGAVWSGVQIAARNLFSIGSTAILARLLSPDDYGLMGMVTTLTAFLLVFSSMGLSWATVRQKDLTRDQVTNLFWINSAAGLLLWILIALLAPLVVAFYGREELSIIALAMGATFLLSGIAVQPMALLQRNIDARQIAIIEIIAVAIGAIAAIVSAILGAGYWALVVQALVNQFVRMIVVLAWTGFQIRRPSMGVGTFAMVGFGGTLALNGLLIYCARNLDSLLIGKVWGAEALGFYTRAYFLMLLPSMLANGVLTNLMVPSLAKYQDDPTRLGEAYRRAARMVTYIGTPMALGLALTAQPAVLLVYGEEWQPVIPLLVWLSIAGATQPIYNTNGWLFTALGKARPYLVLTVINSLLLSVVFFTTVKFGTLALAAGYGIVMGLIIPLPALWFAHRVAGIPFASTMKTLTPVFALNLVMACTVFAVGHVGKMLELQSYTIFAMQVVAGVFVYAAATPVFLRKMARGDLLPMLPAKLQRRLA